MTGSTPDDYIKKIETIRFERQQRMINNPLSWFALAGLYPLQDGENTFANTGGASICIPQLESGLRGSLFLDSGKVYLRGTSSPRITLNGSQPEDTPLRADIDGDPHLIEAGSIAMRIISRGSKFFVRVWDRQSPEVINFKGLNFYAVDAAYRIEARFTPFVTPLILKRTNMIGTEYDQPFIGSAAFTIAGKQYSLIAEEDEDELLFSFIDETRRDTTYGGGRYLLADRPKNNLLILDFNLAVNWPCAYTPFATCPIPPTQNRLAVRIEAGEKKFHPDL